MTLAGNQDEWMKRAQAQYLKHGMSEEKVFLWAQSRWHNVDDPLSKEPESVAEDDLSSWVNMNSIETGR